MRGENGIVSMNSGWRRRKKILQETYKYARKAPELAWGPYICTIAIKSEHSGWPLEVLHASVQGGGLVLVQQVRTDMKGCRREGRMRETS